MVFNRVTDALNGMLLRKGWRIPVVMFALFLAGFLYLQLTDLPFTVERFREISGGGAMLDLTWNYSPETAFKMLDGYGSEGRHYYLYMLSVVDIPFPLLYGSALCGMLLWTAQAAFPNRPRPRTLALLPLLAAAADYAENLGILGMLLRYPGQWRTAAALTNVCTMAKNLLVYTSLGLLLLLALLHLAALLKRKRAPLQL